jgi:phosphate transport system substrate-binding protein
MRIAKMSVLPVLLLLLAAAPQAAAQDSLTALADPGAARGFLVDLSELYRQQRSRTVEISAASTEEVLRAVIDGEADIGAVSRPPIVSRLSEAGLIFQPVVWDAVVVIVNRDNPILNLTLAQAAAIFRGETTSWQPLGAGSADIEVIAVATSGDQADGLEHVFGQLLLRGGAGIRATRTVSDSDAVEQAVAANRYAIGLSSYNSARRNMQVKMLGIEGQPAATNTIRDGTYLLFTPLYLVSRPGGENRRLVSDLMRFSSQGGTTQVLRRVGTIPYTDGMGLLSGQADRDALIQRRMP